VRDATRQSTHGLHFLRLAQLRLRLGLLGDGCPYPGLQKLVRLPQYALRLPAFGDIDHGADIAVKLPSSDSLGAAALKAHR